MITRSDEIHRTARHVLIDVLSRGERRAFDRDAENKLCIEYEISCWIDGCYDEVVDELCLLVQESSSNKLPPLASLFQAWEYSGLSSPVPALRISSLLLHALQQIGKMSSDFTLLTFQVASKCLMYDTNPIPLASLIVYHAESSKEMLEKDMHPIALYAKSLVQFGKFSGTDRLTFLDSLLQGSFKDDSVMMFQEKCKGDQKFTGFFSSFDHLALLRQIAHLSLVLDVSRRNVFTDLFKQLLPIAFLVR
jgi:hypothetical protein